MLTPKQEAFTRAYLETGNASEAYKQAYSPKKMKDTSIRVEACRLLDNPNVALTLEKMQAKASKKHDITVERLTQMALDAYQLAMKDDVAACSAAVKAAEFLGKLHGKLVEKRELTGKDGTALVPVLNVSVTRD